MSYVPPWKRAQKVPQETIVEKPTRKPKFLGNVLGGPDVLENTGVRYTPRSPTASPIKKILHYGPIVKPFNVPPLVPTHNLMKLQPKFREKVLRSMRLMRKTEEKDKKSKKDKKGKKSKKSKKNGHKGKGKASRTISKKRTNDPFF